MIYWDVLGYLVIYWDVVGISGDKLGRAKIRDSFECVGIFHYVSGGAKIFLNWAPI